MADVNFTAYEECAWTTFRLPAGVAPVRYDLRLSVMQLAPPSEVTASHHLDRPNQSGAELHAEWKICSIRSFCSAGQLIGRTSRCVCADPR